MWGGDPTAEGHGDPGGDVQLQVRLEGQPPEPGGVEVHPEEAEMQPHLHTHLLALFTGLSLRGGGGRSVSVPLPCKLGLEWGETAADRRPQLDAFLIALCSRRCAGLSKTLYGHQDMLGNKSNP